MVGALVVMAGCSGDGSDEGAPAAAVIDTPAWFDAELGGTTTARLLRGRPFNQVGRSLRVAEVSRFFDGSDTFVRHFDQSDGLGPLFNETSCVSCHLDGTDPEAPDPVDPGPGPLLRVSARDGRPTSTTGAQIQTRSSSNAVADGEVVVDWTRSEHRYPDGRVVSLRRPRLALHSDDAAETEAAQRSLRVSTPLVGLGLLEAVPIESIDALADPGDDDGDGISGRVNMVDDIVSGGTAPGRFGWKAGQPSVRQQTAVAAVNDIGLTNPDIALTCTDQGPNCVELIGPAELSQLVYDNLVFYNRTIAVPEARGFDDTDVQRGAVVFDEIGCSTCHQPELTTGLDAVEGLSNQTIHPFSDLLLHDMGEGLADGRTEAQASGSEWRTAPLWGLGLRDDVYPLARYLHDGRARSIEEAVLWHGGEAQSSTAQFDELPSTKRRQLLAFLEAL